MNARTAPKKPAENEALEFPRLTELINDINGLNFINQHPKITVDTIHDSTGVYYREYTVNRLLSHMSLIVSRPFNKNTKRSAPMVIAGDTAWKFLSYLFMIEGIEQVRLYPHAVQVLKGANYDWPQIQPGILQAFKWTFEWGDKEHPSISYSRQLQRECLNPKAEIQSADELLEIC